MTEKLQFIKYISLHVFTLFKNLIKQSYLIHMRNRLREIKPLPIMINMIPEKLKFKSKYNSEARILSILICRSLLQGSFIIRQITFESIKKIPF